MRWLYELTGAKKIRGKVFVIGMNKTGTTTMKKALKSFGYSVGNQAAAELIYDQDYFRGDFSRLINYCESADAFQDQPFSAPNTYKALHAAFPRAKYILTVRNSADQWYDSLCRFHSKKFGKDGRLPTSQDLQEATYRRPGFMTNFVKLHGTPTGDPYHKETLINNYCAHIREVRSYFVHNENFLEINVAQPGDWGRLAEFLGRKSSLGAFPHENSSR